MRYKANTGRLWAKLWNTWWHVCMTMTKAWQWNLMKPGFLLVSISWNLALAWVRKFTHHSSSEVYVALFVFYSLSKLWRWHYGQRSLQAESWVKEWLVQINQVAFCLFIRHLKVSIFYSPVIFHLIKCTLDYCLLLYSFIPFYTL